MRLVNAPLTLLRVFPHGYIHLTRNHLVAYISNVDAVFKALADRSRRQLLDRLHQENGQTLGELCRRLDMTRQAVSKHLALLEAANLVATVRRGREKLHYLNPVPIHEISERWIGKYERHRLRALADLKKGLEEEER
jgi:DNA-binding transcriptional ArsR family regulator